MRPIIAYGQTIGRDWIQEWYDTRSGDARRRAAQLRKLGYTVSVGSSQQVTPVGRVRMSLLTIHQVADPSVVPPPDRIEHMNPGTAWHGRQAAEAEDDRIRAEQRGSFIGSHFYRGKREAHRESQEESRRIGLNPYSHEALVHALTEADRRESVKRPQLARLSLYMDAADRVREAVKRGAKPEDAFADVFVPTREMHRVARQLGLKLDVQRGQWVKKNPGAAWHQEQGRMAEQIARRQPKGRRRSYYQGSADAHALSAHESRKMGLNPRQKSRVQRETEYYHAGFGDAFAAAEHRGTSNLTPSIAQKERWAGFTDYWRGWRDGLKSWRGNPNPRGARTLVGRVFKAERWARRWARGRPVRKVKGGWQILAGRKRTPAQERAHRRKVLTGGYGTVPGRRSRRRHIAKAMLSRNPIAVYNPPEGRIIYGRVLAVEAQKTNGSYRGKRFRHSFERDSRVVAYALQDGSVLLKSAAGKRLWQDR